MEDDVLETVLESETSEETLSVEEEVSENELVSEEETEALETSPDVLETSAPSAEVPPFVSLSSLDVDSLTINVSEGVSITGLFPEEEEEFFPVVYASSNALALTVPDNHVVFEMAGQQLVFPSSYVDDLVLIDGYLVNFGSPVTIAVNLQGTASVSNYIISQVTFPTYGSADYITYVTSYGSPYRIVDRYRNTSGSISSYTRTTSAAMTTQAISQPSWYGFSGGRMYSYIFAVALIFLLLWGRFRWKR